MSTVVKCACVALLVCFRPSPGAGDLPAPIATRQDTLDHPSSPLTGQPQQATQIPGLDPVFPDPDTAPVPPDSLITTRTPVSHDPAMGPPPEWHTPSGDSLIVIESFDYPNLLGQFPESWGARKGFREPAKRDIYYRIAKENGNYFLRAETEGEAMNAGTARDVNLRIYSRFRWRWRVHSLPEGARENEEEKNDSAAAVYVVFHGRWFIPRSLKYVWSATLPQGTETESPTSDKVKVVVLESGPGKTGRWVWEEVDAYADYRRLFGGEPRLVKGIAVITDSDNTKQHVKADYDDIMFLIASPDTAEMVPDFMLQNPHD